MIEIHLKRLMYGVLRTEKHKREEADLSKLVRG